MFRGTPYILTFKVQEKVPRIVVEVPCQDLDQIPHAVRSETWRETEERISDASHREEKDQINVSCCVTVRVKHLSELFVS